MRKLNFLAKRKREGILELVEQSEEISLLQHVLHPDIFTVQNRDKIIKIAEEFSAELTDFISRLNTEQIQRYRETLEELVGKT